MLARALLNTARTVGGSVNWNTFADFVGSSKSYAGVRVDEDAAMKLSTAFACTRVLSATGSSLPFKLKKKRSDGGSDDVKDHPVSRILSDTFDPFGEQASVLFRSSRFAQQINGGNAYAQILHDPVDMSVRGLVPIHHSRVEVDQDEGGRVIYEVRKEGGGTDILRAWEMLHIPSINPDPSGLEGVGVVDQARQAIGIGLAQELNEAAQWGNGARPQLIIKSKKKWDPKARQRFRKDWNEIHQGPDRSGKIGILEDGAELEALGINNEQAQFLMLRQHNVEDVCRWYGVQPHMVAHLLRSTNNNIEQQSLEFVQYSLLPWLVVWEKFCNIRLLTEKERKKGLYCTHNVDGLLRGDILTRTRALQIQAMYGALNVDEWRAVENRNPLPDDKGQEYFRQANQIPIDQDPNAQAADAGANPFTSPADGNSNDQQQGN